MNLWMSDAHNVFSPTSLLRPWKLLPMASFMESVHFTFGLLLFLLSPINIFLSVIAFSKESCFLTLCPKSDSFNFAQEEKHDSLETAINGEGTNLNLYNKLYSFYHSIHGYLSVAGLYPTPFLFVCLFLMKMLFKPEF